MLRPILLTTSFVGISILTVFAGCSSSSSKATGGNDSGSAADVVVHHDSGSSSGSSSGGSGDDSGDDSGDSGGSCSAGVPYTATTWTNVVAHQGLCDAADLSAFLVACGDAQTATSCNTWSTANLAGADGGGGSTCGNCIVPPNATGTGGASFVTFDSMGNGYFGPNYPGCIQLMDTTNGSSCAGAYDNLFSCLGLECNLCTGTDGDGTSEDPEACENGDVATGGICASYLSPYQTKCMTDNADGGVAAQCSPGSATNPATINPDWTLIINLICGGGATDAGGQ